MTVVKIKKANSTEKCVIKKLKFENYKNCLEVIQFENKMNHLKIHKMDIDSIKKLIKDS